MHRLKLSCKKFHLIFALEFCWLFFPPLYQKYFEVSGLSSLSSLRTSYLARSPFPLWKETSQLSSLLITRSRALLFRVHLLELLKRKGKPARHVLCKALSHLRNSHLRIVASRETEAWKGQINYIHIILKWQNRELVPSLKIKLFQLDYVNAFLYIWKALSPWDIILSVLVISCSRLYCPSSRCLICAFNPCFHLCILQRLPTAYSAFLVASVVTWNATFLRSNSSFPLNQHLL